MAGVGATGNAYPLQMSSMAPLNGQARVVNKGVSGQLISGTNSMRNRRYASVDLNYQAGKLNILVAWEATNSIWVGGLTGAQAGAEMKLYCQECLTAHPDWLIILPTTIPRYNTDGVYGTNLDAANAELIAFNNYIKANFRAMGARAVVDVRVIDIFNYTGAVMTPEQSAVIYDKIHLTAAGYGTIARLVANSMLRLPRR